MTMPATRGLRWLLPCALVLVVALGIGGSAHATVATAPARSTVGSTPRVLADCLTPSRRPHGITMTCADGNALLRRAHWKWWGQESAGGTGTFVANDCQPNCASGHFHRYPVTDRLHGVVHHMFGRLTLHLVHPVKGMKRTLTFQLATRPV
jgi:hypothetical protein